MYKHILVPTDGSARSRKAARIAARLARRLNASLTALYVVPEGVPTAFSGGAVYGGGILGRQYEQLLRRQVSDALAVVEREAKLAGAAYSGVHTIARHPWKAIVRTARSRHCDLIVMGSHGRGGLQGMALGSETAKVLGHSKTPVLVCR